MLAALGAGYDWLSSTQGYWGIALARTVGTDKTTFSPTQCGTAVPSTDPKSCLQPELGIDSDSLRVTLQPNANGAGLSLAKFGPTGALSGTPTYAQVRLCFANASTMDRTWRQYSNMVMVSATCNHLPALPCHVSVTGITAALLSAQQLILLGCFHVPE